MQIVQFIAMCSQAVLMFFFSEYPRFLSGIMIGYVTSLLLLFFNFYIRKHVPAGGKAKKEE